MTEWREIRCPVCVELGYTDYQPLILFKAFSEFEALSIPVVIQVKCWHCKSLVSFDLQEDSFTVDKMGTRNHKRQTAAFE